MAASLLGTFTAAEGSGALTTGSRTTTSGSLITIYGATYAFGGAPGTMTLSDNKSNVYTQQTQQNQVSGSNNTGIRTAYNIGGTRGTSHTVSKTDTGENTLVAHEWSGIAASPTTAHQNSTGTSTTPSGAVTTTVTSLIVGVMAYMDSTTTFAVSGSTTLGVEVDENSDFQAMGTGYRTGVAAGSPTVTWTLAASREWLVNVSAFEEDGGGGGGTAVPVFRHHYAVMKR